MRPRLDQMTSRCGGSSSWGVVLGRALDSPGQTAGEEGASSRRGRAGPGGPRSWDLSVWRRRRNQGRRQTRATCCSESWTLSPTNGLSTIADINRRQSTQFITRSVRLYTCRGFEAKPKPKSTTRCDNRRWRSRDLSVWRRRRARPGRRGVVEHHRHECRHWLTQLHRPRSLVTASLCSLSYPEYLSSPQITTSSLQPLLCNLKYQYRSMPSL